LLQWNSDVVAVLLRLIEWLLLSPAACVTSVAGADEGADKGRFVGDDDSVGLLDVEGNTPAKLAGEPESLPPPTCAVTIQGSRTMAKIVVDRESHDGARVVMLRNDDCSDFSALEQPAEPQINYFLGFTTEKLSKSLTVDRMLDKVGVGSPSPICFSQSLSALHTFCETLRASLVKTPDLAYVTSVVTTRKLTVSRI
jgi:hypothetical protein